MLLLIKQVFLVFLSFSMPLATNYVSLKNEPCKTRPTLVDLSSVEISYYPFLGYSR